MRLHRVAKEFEGSVRLRIRAFPLEVYGGGAAPRDILTQEWWLAALQEPAAEFSAYSSDDWPATTLPAFEAVWCASQQGHQIGLDFDLRVRRAFFAQGRNIGHRDVMIELAREAGLDMEAFTRLFESEQPRQAVLAEGMLAKDTLNVHGTPTMMLEDGRKLRMPMSYPRFRDGKIVSVAPLPCHGEGCDTAVRGLFEAALGG